jgi:hypothetical protein
LRYSERKWFRRIVNSQAVKFVPGRKLSMLASARNNVSCTRSSALSRLPLRDIAKARSRGTVAIMSSRVAGSRAIRGLSAALRLIETREQLNETVGNTFAENAVVHRTELVPDRSLYVPVETRRRFRPRRRAFGSFRGWFLRLHQLFFRLRLYHDASGYHSNSEGRIMFHGRIPALIRTPGSQTARFHGGSHPC